MILEPILILILGNIIADLLIFYEVRHMRREYEVFSVKTREMEIHLCTIREGLNPALEAVSKNVVKGLSGVIGHYQGKAVKAEKDAMGDITGSVEGLTGIMDMLKSTGHTSDTVPKNGYL